MEENTYNWDDYRQDMLAEESARQFDAHNAEIERAGGVCTDANCWHNQEPCEDF